MNWLIALLLIFSLLSTDLVDINSADEDALRTLPGIGPVKAEAIVEYRDNYGHFQCLSDLEYVSGIGPATISGIEEYIFIDSLSLTAADTLHWLENADSLAPLLSIYFLDVGQGDAILISAAFGETWLFDGGPDAGGPLEPAVVWRLDELGVDTLDVVAFSHPHSDHVGGLASVVRNFTVLKVMDPGMSFSSFVYEDFLNAVMDADCDYMLLEEGSEFQMSRHVTASVISAGIEEVDLNINENSILLQITCGNFSTLLTGDIEENAERMLTLSAEPVTVLKVPHHGSITSVFPPYLRRLSPQFAVFSAGRNNSFGHPHPRVIEIYMELGAKILRTDRHGTIVVRTDGEKVSVSDMQEYCSTRGIQ